MDSLAGKVAVITGGAGGIGLAFAERFAAAGAKLVLADIETGALDTAVTRLSAVGYEVTGLRTDVAKLGDVQALAAHATASFGKVNILCNNAGVSITGPTWRMSMDDWRWVWDVNVWGVVHGVHAFLPGMLAHGEPAHVVNTGSLASFVGNGDHAPYCSSKAAVLGMSQSLFSEMKAMNTNVGVSIVCPGMVATRINQSWRNRPDGDTPWSDRESADDAFREGSAVMQGAGIAPEAIAESTYEAILEDRFYVFTGPNAPVYLDVALGRAIRAENPFVMTWGEDNRSLETREPPPWARANGEV